MSRIPARLFGAAATIALVIAPMAAATPAGAATRASHRHTGAMEVASEIGGASASYSKDAGRDGRSARSLRSAIALAREMGVGYMVVTGLADRNHDGLDDDDGRVTFMAGGRAVTLTIGTSRKQVGKVTYGPAWKTKAPKRTNHPPCGL